MDNEQGVQLSDLKHAARRRAGLFALVTGALILIGIFTIAVLPTKYTASSMLMIEPQTISSRLIEAGLESSDVNNRLHLMTAELLSRGRLSRIIDDLGLYGDESEEMTREEVIELMRSDLHVEPVFPELEQQLDNRNREFEINTFRIFYTNREPRTAAAVANRLANDFIDKHIQERVRQSGDTTEFIEAERERLAARIAEIENRVAAVKAENAGRLPENLDSNQRLLERLVDSLRAAERELAVAQSDEAFFRQQVLAYEEQEPVDDISTPGRRLELLELQLAEHRSRGFTDKHPDVIATQGEIEALEAQLEETGDTPAAGSIAFQNAQAEQRRAALRGAASRQELKRLAVQIQEVESRISDTPRVAEQLAALEREYRHLFEAYQGISNKRQEAAVAADMERRQKGEQFRLLESAVAPIDPTWPNYWLFGALGVVLALLGGAGVAVLAEAGDSSFHEPRNMQRELKLPVLAAIPSIQLEADEKQARRRRTRRLLAAAAVTAFVLLGSVAGNWIVNGVPGVVKELVGAGEQGGQEARTGGATRG